MQTRCQLNERWQRHVSKLECTIASESAQSRADAAWSTQVWHAVCATQRLARRCGMQMWHADAACSVEYVASDLAHIVGGKSVDTSGCGIICFLFWKVYILFRE